MEYGQPILRAQTIASGDVDQDVDVTPKPAEGVVSVLLCQRAQWCN